MQLRVTRPGFIEGIRALKAVQGIQNYDVNTMATRQEMRTYVCGQCHVEYYFQGPEKRLVYPWAQGLQVDNMLAYYDATHFKDWVHADTGAPVLKAQHPEFELWNQGIHARSGVACADCHMPYIRVGATKISDHHVRSPLLNINHACQTCHHWPEAELQARVETIQERTYKLRSLAMDALIDLINDLKTARTAGKTDEQLARARDFQRKAQFYLDFIEAENSMGFHAPQEAARILGASIDFSRQGQVALRALQ
jgi:nitrite reductase (cytochrome c-552)